VTGIVSPFCSRLKCAREDTPDRLNVLTPCGYASPEVPPANGKRAAAVGPEAKAANLRRVWRLEGQVRGLQKMVEEDRCCQEIMIQISAAQEALRTVGRELMRNPLRQCVPHAGCGGPSDGAEPCTADWSS